MSDSDSKNDKQSACLKRMVRLYVIEHQISNAVRVYITGRLTHTNPPRPKVGPIETAKKWKTAKGAMDWRNKYAAQYDMRVCRLPNVAISPGRVGSSALLGSDLFYERKETNTEANGHQAIPCGKMLVGSGLGSV